MRKISLLTALVLLFVCRLAHADVHVHPSVNVSETYDSNINQVHTDPTSDYITKLTFGLAATYEGKLDTMQLNGAVSRNIYASNSAFDNTDESLNLSLNHEFDRFDRMSASENFIHSQDPQTFEDAFGRKQGIYAYYRNALSLARVYFQEIWRERAFIKHNHPVLGRIIRDVASEGDYAGEGDGVILLACRVQKRAVAKREAPRCCKLPQKPAAPGRGENRVDRAVVARDVRGELVG